MTFWFLVLFAKVFLGANLLVESDGIAARLRANILIVEEAVTKLKCSDPDTSISLIARFFIIIWTWVTDQSQRGS